MRGGEFLQSRAWEELQKSVGRKTWRLKNVLVVQHTMKVGMNYLYCPRPDFSGPEHVTSFLESVAEHAAREQSIFLKIDPHADMLFQNTNHRIISSQSYQPRKTVYLDISSSEEILLAQMHEKTRYNIRLAQKKGVVVALETGLHNVKQFWKLLCATAARDRFRTHQKKYYQELLAASSDGFSNELFCARYQGELLACALTNFYAPTHTATYLHGASSEKFRNVMASYLLHWRMIQEAKKRNFQYYDFWGIDEERFLGVTRFKSGFGGSTVKYPYSRDIVFRPFLYWLYHYAKRII